MKNIWWAFIGISNQGQCKILKNDKFLIKNNNFHKMTKNDLEIDF